LTQALTERFSGKLPARHYYDLLHQASKDKNETPSQFLDRCRAFSLKTIMIWQDATEQRILKEEAEFRLLTSFIYGLRGSAGRELKLRTPNSIEEALDIATIIYNTEKLENREKEKQIFWTHA
jgi:hypothetical protein